MSDEVQVVESPNRSAMIRFGNNGLQLQSLDDLWRFAKYIVAAKLCPKGFESPEAVVVALQLGAEIGLPPMASVQNITVINGRPSVWGDAPLGVVRSTGTLEKFQEWYEEDGQRCRGNPVKFNDSTTAFCVVQRKGYEEVIASFSVADAKRAGLWGKTGRDGQPTPWITNPARMLRYRARAFNLRDNYGDVLKGILTREEAADIPPERDITAHVAVGPAPGSAAAELKAKLASKPVVTSEPVTHTDTAPTPEKQQDGPSAAAGEAVPATDAPVSSSEMTKGACVMELEQAKADRNNVYLDAFGQFGTEGMALGRHSVDQLRAMVDYCRNPKA